MADDRDRSRSPRGELGRPERKTSHSEGTTGPYHDRVNIGCVGKFPLAAATEKPPMSRQYRELTALECLDEVFGDAVEGKVLQIA